MTPIQRPNSELFAAVPKPLPLIPTAVSQLIPLARAQSLGVHAFDPGRMASGWRVPPDGAAFLAESLRTRWSTYRDQLRRCRRAFSPQSVHRLRVATRRLMTFYALLGQMTNAPKADKAARKLKRRLKSLGRLRDIQVQAQFIEERLEQFAGLKAMHQWLVKQEQKLKKSVSCKVRQCKTRKLKKWTAEFCRALEHNPKTHEHHEALSANAHHALATAFAEIAAQREAMSAANAESIHSARVAFKKLRYMVEALSPAFTGFHKKDLRRFGVYQTRSGAVQDLEVLQKTMAEFVAECPDEAPNLEAFAHFLEARHSRAIELCLKHADDLYALTASLGLPRQEQKLTFTSTPTRTATLSGA